MNQHNQLYRRGPSNDNENQRHFPSIKIVEKCRRTTGREDVKEKKNTSKKLKAKIKM